MEARESGLRNGFSHYDFFHTTLFGSSRRTGFCPRDTRRSGENSGRNGEGRAGEILQDLVYPRLRGNAGIGLEGLLDRSIRGHEPGIQSLRRSGWISEAGILED